jgi:hypothetical protein
MRSDELIRRDVLHSLAGLPLIALLAKANEAAAQPTGSPVRVDTGAWSPGSSSRRRSLDFSPTSTENTSFVSRN